jgi:Na+/melibiose symporter-like transporter
MSLKAKRLATADINVKGDRIVQEANRMRNRLTFSLGTVGRDMRTHFTACFSWFICRNLGSSGPTFLGASTIMLVMKIYDGFNDPFMGFMSTTPGRVSASTSPGLRRVPSVP